MTDKPESEIHFDKGNVVRKGHYCPEPIPSVTYLRAIGCGLVPPFGSAGNITGNTAGDAEYSEAGWWGDEMMRIANVNDWHFSSAAISWYVGLHRLALLYVDKARNNPEYWVNALHYEALALHSLTDLFAFGHVVTNRAKSSYGAMSKDNLINYPAYQWMQNAIVMGGGLRDDEGMITATAGLPDLEDTFNPRNDFMPSYLGNWAIWANRERKLHDYFNEHGAKVRNLRGESFKIFGDGKLKDLPDFAAKRISNSVRASVQSLFDAYVELENGTTTVDQLARSGSSFFEALTYIPIFIEKDPDNYFSGMWTTFAMAVDVITGSGVVPSDWSSCQVQNLNGSVSDYWPKKHDLPCTIFPSISSAEIE